MPAYVQLTLQNLFHLVGVKPKNRARKSEVIAVRKRKNQKRFMYVVRSSESYSSPTGHLVSFLYPNLIPFDKLKYYPQLTPLNRRARVTCTCPAWQYWGSAFLASREGYELANDKEFRPANIRDPKEENYTCKHVVAVTKHLGNRPFTQLFAEFAIGTGRTAYAKLVNPIIREALHRMGVYDGDIDDVISGSDEETFEDILDEHGLIVPEAPDATAV